MPPRVDGATRIYTVLGHPVHHTLSPLIQNAAFRAAGRNAVYVSMDVAPERLGEALLGLHACGIRGVNLTAPHKEAGWEFVVDATPQAERARSVNTLRWEERGWFGHATDGPGFLAWVHSIDLSLRGARVLLLGAGGAARSIAPEIASLGPSAIQVVSRDGVRAGALAAWLAPLAPSEVAVTSAELTEDAATREGFSWDVLVRAVASSAVEPGEVAWWKLLSPRGTALELNYGERARDSRARAALQGNRYEDGRGLLLHQGALSLEFWTGEPAPLGAMRAALDSAPD